MSEIKNEEIRKRKAGSIEREEHPLPDPGTYLSGRMGRIGGSVDFVVVFVGESVDTGAAA